MSSPKYLIRLSLLLWGLSLAACAGEIGGGAFVDHEVDEDFESISASVPGIPDSFGRNNIVSDEVFTNQDLTGDMVQGFLENAPYFGGMRSWLADVEVNGTRASDALVAAARSNNINPLMLLARLQVEKSAVSRTQRPSQHNIDYTMGCGCHDNQPCNTVFRGFDKQMECAADTLRKHFDASVNGTGQWKSGRSLKSLDPLNVTPANHATASLYSYTPWVLQGAGGNWLVWNVTKKYANALLAATPVPPPAGGTPNPPQPDSGSSDLWVGSLCQESASCDLSASGVSDGECFNWFDEDTTTLHGFCSLDCVGTCPDKSGEAPTACVQVSGSGQCVSQAASQNGDCSAIPGTTRVSKPRFIGGGTSTTWRDVCLPKHEALSCTSGGATGVCTNTSTNSCAGTLVSNACPGPAAIRCCLP